MADDIRDRFSLSGDEVAALNFIASSSPYMFRKFYRSGLRSHIFEVLKTDDLHDEIYGRVIDGIRMFPKARPVKMFRILRQRFTCLSAVFFEIRKYNLLLSCLGAPFIAKSDEIVADYTGTGDHQIVLCGLQEYVEGEILDPWRIEGSDHLGDLYSAIQVDWTDPVSWNRAARENIRAFVTRIRRMISQTGYIPDLAGIGNLILTPSAGLKLVDINNIVKIRLDGAIRIDDKGYPSCDVSVHVLSILENKFLKNDPPPDDPLYRIFLTPERRQRVRELEKKFYAGL